MTASPLRPHSRRSTASRTIIATEPAIDPAELNSLLQKAGEAMRPLPRLQQALHHSYLCITARTLSDRRLVGFVRATSDEALNASVWDLLADPLLPDPKAIKLQLLDRLLRELRQLVPGCSVSILSRQEDQLLLHDLRFVSDPGGIRAMVLMNLSASMEGFEPPTLRTGI
jgi:hypothetical protein